MVQVGVVASALLQRRGFSSNLKDHHDMERAPSGMPSAVSHVTSTWVVEDLGQPPLATVDRLSCVQQKIQQAVSLECNQECMFVFNLTGSTGLPRRWAAGVHACLQYHRYF